MADYYSFLNYIAFVILYIICLYFVSQDFSEIIGFYILFIIHTASTIFIGKDIVNVFSGGSISNPASMISILLLGVVMAGLSCNFVSLILIMLMLSNLQTKFDRILSICHAPLASWRHNCETMALMPRTASAARAVKKVQSNPSG